MKTIKYAGVAVVFVLLAFVGTAVSQSEADHAPVIIHRVISPREGFAPTAGSTGAQSPAISYHRGPVMASPNVYLIWYGNWNQSTGSDTQSGQTIVTDFLSGLTGSSYFAINKTYSTPTGTFTVAGTTTDNYSQGKNLTDAGVQAVVSNAIPGRLPLDENGVYFVLTSTDVAESSGFCTKYCGWHSYGTISGANIKYSFVGNSNRCLGGCAAQTTSPNGNPGVDGMVSVIAHELAEANTDPNLNAWYDPKGAENADKCAWTFGQNQTLLSSGAYYNMTLQTVSGPRNYLIQRNLQANNSRCYVAWNGQQ